ncbi:MAG: glycosyltransferase family 2 protein [Saprospiraceae bacterium]|nr:glycosyltransferase family 2 protein [Saprospiraceae bacterium]
MEFSLVIPIYNEADNLDLLYSRCKAILDRTFKDYEIILVNDGSKDLSINQIKKIAAQDSTVRYIDLSRNFGHQIAVMAGLDAAVGQTIGIIDADLQDPPELISPMYEKIKEGNEVVYARRKTREGETLFKKWTAGMYYRLLSSLTSIDIPLDTGDFRLIDQKILHVLKQMPEKNKFLRGQIAWAGFNQTYVEYDRAARHAGETGYNLRKMLRLAIDGITSFSNIPLKLVTYFGILVSLFAFFATLYVLYSIYIIKDFVPGWGSLLISILFIGGVQMIAIGIIGEYLSRMNQNILNRPLYIIKDSNLASTQKF